MNEKQEHENSALVPASSASLSGVTSRLVQRGLQALERPTVTPEQIQNARSTIREYKGLSDVAIRMVLERPPLWEYLLCFQIITDEIAGYESLRLAIELGIMPNPTETVDFEDTFTWSGAQIQKLLPLLEMLEDIVNKEFPVVFGLPGEAGDPLAIVLAARKIGLIYEQVLDLSLHVLTTGHDPIFEGYFRELSKTITGIANQIDEYFVSSMDTIRKAMDEPKTDYVRTIELSFTLRFISQQLTIEQEKAITLHQQKIFQR